jgi:hypothetical protein
MGDLENIRQQIESMPDLLLINCIGAGAKAYRPGVFELYRQEAEKRGLETSGIVEDAAKGARHQANKKIIGDYIFAAIPVFGLLLFIALSVQLARHRSGKKPIEGTSLRHAIRQWRLSIGSVLATAGLIALILLPFIVSA